MSFLIFTSSVVFMYLVTRKGWSPVVLYAVLHNRTQDYAPSNKTAQYYGMLVDVVHSGIIFYTTLLHCSALPSCAIMLSIKSNKVGVWEDGWISSSSSPLSAGYFELFALSWRRTSSAGRQVLLASSICQLVDVCVVFYCAAENGCRCPAVEGSRRKTKKIKFWGRRRLLAGSWSYMASSN